MLANVSGRYAPSCSEYVPQAHRGTMLTRVPKSSNISACIFCRSKHLKCDYTRPSCYRCLASGIECIYVQSRRGQAGGRRKTNAGIRSNSTTSIQGNDAFDHESTFSSPSIIEDISITVPATIPDKSQDYLIDVYYQTVHPAHPFLIPHHAYRRTPGLLPQHVMEVMCLLAGRVVGSYCRDESVTIQSLLERNLLSNVHKVQMCLLLTIASYASCNRSLGDQALKTAADTAYAIGLDSENFKCDDNVILRESWRRTWWELYTLGGLISVLNPSTSRVHAASDRLLPSSEDAYRNCMIFESRTLGQMRDRHFAGDDFKYSSFAYRIEAVRILTMILDHAQQHSTSFEDTTSHSCGAAIKTFMLSLPTPKRSATERDVTDEMMECAIMTINLASIVHHTPQSGLLTVRTFDTVCATSRPYVYTTHQQSHEAAALRSAAAISQLLIDRASLKTISPCFSCALAFATTLQLSAYCKGQAAEQSACLKEYIQLSLSALDTMGENWKIAKVVKGQLAGFARDVFIQSVPNDNIQTVEATQEPLALENAIVDDAWLSDFINDPAYALAEGQELGFQLLQ